MVEVLDEMDRCCGCTACYNVCPQQAIVMREDKEGFLYPYIDQDKCIDCKKCQGVCPVYNKFNKDNFTSPEVYAAWSNDNEIRMNSTSGGIFSEIVLSFLSQEGYVCGAIYGDNQQVEHYIISKKDDLVKIRQSKYVQSDKKDVYRRIDELLKAGKRVLFCGTPCECAGLQKYLGEGYSNLVVIDFICRGANSPKVYRKFLEELESEYGSKISKVWFKNKTYGWQRFCTKIEFENGKIYLRDRYHDRYIIGYIIHNLFMRPSCSRCLYKEFPRIADITLGDFWGIILNTPNVDIDRGTSLVMINSAKGQSLFSDIRERIFCEKKALSEALSKNKSIEKSAVFNENRKYFFDNLDKMSFKKITGKIYRKRKVNLLNKIKRDIKACVVVKAKYVEHI